MKRVLLPAVRALDSAAASLALMLRWERPALLSFMFHGLFADRAEAEGGLVDPYQPLTVADFRGFLEAFLAAGYRFIRPDDLLAGLDPEGRYALVTFDDGYANNLRLPALLRAFQVPATVFITAENLAAGKAFWWDVLFRELRRRGTAPGQMTAQREQLKRLSPREIEASLVRMFGAEALRPAGDVDRPMTLEELRDFAREPLISLGNHSLDHALLDRCDEREIERQIFGCQDFLERITGQRPEIIAYPNGNYDSRVLRVARAAGLRLGLTVESRKAPLPLDADALLALPRFMLTGGPSMAAQFRQCRSDLQLLNGLKRVVRGRKQAGLAANAAAATAPAASRARGGAGRAGR